MKMLLLALAVLVLQDATETRKVGTLGAKTRAPSEFETTEYALPQGTRVQGQMVDSVDEDGPAAKAGLARGDAIVKMHDIRIYSLDQIIDILRVTKPGTVVTLVVKRATTYKQEELKLTLGERESKEKRIGWEYAGVEQVEAALAQAKKDGKKLLVGLSGSET